MQPRWRMGQAWSGTVCQGERRHDCDTSGFSATTARSRNSISDLQCEIVSLRQRYFFIEQGNLHRLKTGFLLQCNVSLLLAMPPYSTCSMRVQACFVHKVVCREDSKDLFSLLSKVTALAAPSHISCSSLMLCHWNRVLFRQTKTNKNTRRS